MKVHQGLTTCQICHKVICTMQHLRRHLQLEHRVSPDEAKMLMTPSVQTKSIQTPRL